MMIRAVGYALSWEYWRRGMLWFVPTALALMIGIILLSSVQPLGNIGFRWTDVGTHLRPALVPLVIAMPVIVALASWLALRRHYVLPVPTATLVAWSLANGALATAGTYCCAALAFNGTFDADWPLAIPALCSAAVYVACQAALWWIGPSRGLFAVLGAVACGSLAAVGKLSESRPLFDRLEMPQEWSQVSAAGIAVWLAAVGLSYLLAVNGVARDRRGQAWSLDRFSRWWVLAGDAVSRRNLGYGSEFRSAASAQFWFEWRAKGQFVPLTLAGMLGALWLSFGVLALEPHEISIMLASFTFLFVLASPFVGVFLGSRTNGFDLKSFTATRPLPDSGLAAAVLCSAAAAVGLAAVIWLVGSVAALAVWLPEETWQSLQRTWNSGLAEIGLLCLISWTFVGLGVSLALARQWFVCWGGLVFAALLLSFAYSLDRLPHEASEVLIALVAAACFGSTIAAFVAAWRRELMSSRALFACLAGYLVLLALLLASLYSLPLSCASAIGFGAAPFAPFAAAPLALSWNRHR